MDRFQTLEHRIKTLNLDSKSSSSPGSSFEISGNSEYCYSLLNSAEDKEAKSRLQEARLKYVLRQLQKEREDTSFSRVCLFCSKLFTGNRSLLFDHLMEAHNFSIGSPDNIVFVNELLDHLESLLKNLQCLYCEKVFKDYSTLKEHMRKREHKRINPENKAYDRFYLINYLELGKTWVQIHQEVDGNYKHYFEKEMMDWEEEEESTIYVCLFCHHTCDDFDATFLHMKDEHKFDFKFLKQTYTLGFYKQIKLINFIRKKINEKECIICDEKCMVYEDLMRHMTMTGHITMLPDPSKWDQMEFFFPTYENDSLLCGLDCNDSDPPECDVLPEDASIPDTFISKEELLEIM